MFKALGIGVAAAVAAIWSPAMAFDTGPHATITEQALALAGYNRAAADAVQVENWLTDYYTSAPGSLTDAQKCSLEKLHFDDVFTDADVAAYWQTLLNNTIAAARKAKADNDYVEAYAVMGISLHVVQDFYSHSNWVESSGDTGAAFDVTTYFQWKQAPYRRTAVVHTGWYANCLNIPQGSHTPHGGYTEGMNHDSVVRPNFNRAYVYALSASYEWVQQIWQALASAPGPRGFENRMMNYQPSAADAAKLAADQEAALYLSEWIDNPVSLSTLDGHWNGNHSGYAAAFASFALAWTSAPDSIYVSTFKTRGVYTALSQGLYQPATGSLPTLYPGFIGGTVVDMHVAWVCANIGVGDESYFGQVVATNGSGPGFSGGAPGYPIRDAAQHHLSCITTPWEYLTVVPVWSNTATLEYTLWDEYGWPGPPSATAVPINGGATDLTFLCTMRPTLGCTWGNKGGALQPMPTRLNLKGSSSKGAALSNITLTLAGTYYHGN